MRGCKDLFKTLVVVVPLLPVVRGAEAFPVKTILLSSVQKFL
jgi:hypothetical protein